MEEIINNLMLIVSKYTDKNNLSTIKNEISTVMKDYDISHRSTELIKYDNELPKCFEYFMVTKKIEGISEKTLDLYKYYISDFLYATNKPIEEITSNDVRVYLYQTQQQRKISNRSLDSRRSALSSFFGWISAEKYINTNPMLVVNKIKYERKERIPLTDVELEKIRSNCLNVRDRAILEVLYSSACRVTELIRLKRDDVNMDNGEVKLFGKGNKHRTSYLSDTALFYLKQYLDTRTDDIDCLFITRRKPYAGISKNGVEAILRKLGQKSKLDRALFPHLLRKTSATNLIKRGMDVTQLKTLLGHESLDTTMIYTKISDTDIKYNHKKYI